MRIGVIGAGAMGAMHASAWTRMPDVTLAGIAARTTARVQPLATSLGVPGHTDVQALLDDDTIDAIDVTAPTAFHRELAIAALERGKHVFCETPLAPNLADADAIAAAARRSGRLVQVALLSRVAEPGVQVREWIRAGAFGRPLAGSFARLWPGLAELGTPGDHHGDALEECALFDFDWLVWCFGMPRSVTATAPGWSRRGIDHAFALLDFGDLRAAVEASEQLPATFPFRIAARLVCEAGAVEWEARFDGPGPPSVTLVRYPREGRPEPVPPVLENPYDAECARFVRVVRGEVDPELLGVAAAVDGLRVVAAARESVACGGPVALNQG